jgi:hypothetical protein
MERIGKLAITLKGFIPALRTRLDEWRPEPMKTELQYRDALLAFLRESLPEEARVEKEYRDSGTTADLFVRWTMLLKTTDVFFEIKRNLKKKTDYDRLIGQVAALGPGKNNIIVVLVGDTDSGLVGRLREQYKSEINPMFPGVAPLLAIHLIP